jgi:hypothetical protein
MDTEYTLFAGAAVIGVRIPLHLLQVLTSQ